MVVSTEIDQLTPVVKRMFMKKIHDYIGHSFYIYSHSNVKGFNKKIESITELSKTVNDINTAVPINNLCLQVYHLRYKLYDLLPNPNNNSYTNSLSIFNEIINFCKSILLIK